MVAIRENVRLVEEFGDPNFGLYTCNQSTTDDQNMGRTPGPVHQWGLSTQNHIDVRTFAAPGWQPTNKIPNGSFESSISGVWTSYGTSGTTCTVAQSTAVPAAFGQKTLAITCTATGTGNMGTQNAQVIVASGGITYTATAWVYSPSVSVQAQMMFAVVNASGSTLSTPTSTAQATTVGSWTQLGPFTFTAPAGTAQVTPLIVLQHPTSGDVHYVDGFQLFVQGATNGAEEWSVSPASTSLLLGTQAVALNHWPALETQVPATTSVTLTSIDDPIDLTQIGGNPNVALTLPGLPSGLSLANTTLSLSSDGGMTWTTAAFSASSHTIGTGNTYAMWPLSTFAGGSLDLTKVNGVRLVLDNTSGSAINVTLMALRVLDPNWVAKDVDTDNKNGALRQCIPLDGNPAELPVPNNQVLPALWHAASPGGVDDPRPINGDWAAVFYTGNQSGFNSLTFNLRGVNGTDETGLDLTGQIQAQLNGPQPGLATSVLIGRTVGDLDTKQVGALESQSMENMDAVGATVDQSWLQFQVAWGSVPGISITRSTAPLTDYQWTGGALQFTDGTESFQDGTFYLAVVSLTDTTCQLRVYTLNQTTFAINSVLFDTGVIQDSYRLIRRQGRVGWKATFQDGDSYIRSVRPESLMFAEYRSAALHSNTPVAGVRIYSNTCPADQLWSSWSATEVNGSTPTLTPDTARTISGQSTRVDVVNPQAGQGLISNVLTPLDDPISGVTNWKYAEVDFQLWFPSSALNAGAALSLYLLSSDGNVVPLSVPRIDPDQWQEIKAFAPAGLQSGRYQLGIGYSGPVATFWVDSVNVTQRCCIWSARATPSSPWVDLGNLIDSDTAGAIFTTRGPALQVRAQALRQDAVVMGSPKVVPIYAPLGRLVWPEDAVVDTVSLSAPTPIGTSASPTHGSPVTFTSGVSPTPAGTLVNWLWSFGDGTSANGPTVFHTYAVAGTYAVTLTVEDIYGVRTTYNTSLGVL